MGKIFAPHATDGYKLGHAEQYINGTTNVYSNETARSNKYAFYTEDSDGKMVVFGFQKAIKNLHDMWEDFFSMQKEAAIKKYKRRIKTYLGNDHGDHQIELMEELHNFGKLPLIIKTLDEGVLVNPKTPLMTITNTCASESLFYWLVNYIETFVSQETWSACNDASVARQYYLTSKKYGELTSDYPSTWLMFANHCFAARGLRGVHDAKTSGMAHLLYSYGTDTLVAIDGMEDYYQADADEELIACSVNATEHATTTQRIAWFRKNGSKTPEKDSMLDLATRIYPKGILSYVADSEDYYFVLTDILPSIKDQILARQPDSNGLCSFVIRPDSSPKTPLEIICGDQEAPVGSPEYKGSLELLWETFEGTTNSKGYRVLNPKVGLIYGDSITPELQKRIYEKMMSMGFSATNVLFGVGSWGFLKDSSRDTYGIAVKGTSSIVNSERIDMQKTPKTAGTFKKSAKGLLRVELEDGEYVVYDNQTEEQEAQGELKVRYCDGEFLNQQTLSEIRKRTMG